MGIQDPFNLLGGLGSSLSPFGGCSCTCHRQQLGAPFLPDTKNLAQDLLQIQPAKNRMQKLWRRFYDPEKLGEPTVRVSSTTIVRISLKDLRSALLTRAIHEAAEEGCPTPTAKQVEAAELVILNNGEFVPADEIEVRW